MELTRGGTMQTQKQHGIGDSFRGLMAAVINRALADLGDRGVIRASDRVRDEAMVWVSSTECEAFCDALYRTIREKAAVLYRRFLEEAESREKAPRKRRKCPGHVFTTFCGKTS
jgi:hypothetical protein